jgi:hypothetical protein
MSVSFSHAEFVANISVFASVKFSDLFLTYALDAGRNACRPSRIVFVIAIQLEPKLKCTTNSSKSPSGSNLKRINLAVLELGHPFKCTHTTQLRGAFLRLVIRNTLKTTHDNTILKFCGTNTKLFVPSSAPPRKRNGLYVLFA